MIFRLLAILMWVSVSFSAQDEGWRAHAFVGTAPSTVECSTLPIGDTDNHCASACVAGSELAQAARPAFEPLLPDQPDVPPAVPPAIGDLVAPIEVARRSVTTELAPQSAHLRDLGDVRLLI